MAILFADLGGSSALYKSAGNLAAKSSIDTNLDITRKIICHYKGEVVKSIGDELMCCFANINDCLGAAITVQKRLSQQLLELDLCINIGISFGETIVEKSDLFGDSVNQAAHLTNLASGGQILISHGSNQRLNQELSAFSKEFDRITYKGSQESALIYRVFWQDETSYGEETKLVDVEKKNFHDSTHLTIEYREAQFVIDVDSTPFLIGRDEGVCDLSVQGGQVSREHCQITYSRGKFVLVDHSTNGCYLSPANKQSIYIRREEYPLIEPISITLGLPKTSADGEEIKVYG